MSSIARVQISNESAAFDVPRRLCPAPLTTRRRLCSRAKLTAAATSAAVLAATAKTLGAEIQASAQPLICVAQGCSPMKNGLRKLRSSSEHADVPGQSGSPGRTRRFAASARPLAGFADDFVGSRPVESRGLADTSLNSVRLSILSIPFGIDLPRYCAPQPKQCRIALCVAEEG